MFRVSRSIVVATAESVLYNESLERGIMRRALSSSGVRLI